MRRDPFNPLAGGYQPDTDIEGLPQAPRGGTGESPRPYQPSGACMMCDFNTVCHKNRQRVMDFRGVGRHTSCAFYAGIREATQAARTLEPGRVKRILRFLLQLRRRASLREGVAG